MKVKVVEFDDETNGYSENDKKNKIIVIIVGVITII